MFLQFYDLCAQIQNTIAGMRQTLLCPQLFQATPAQSGGNLTHPYWPAMGSYLAGYDQQSQMINTGAENSNLIGRNSSYNTSFDRPPFMHTSTIPITVFE